MNASTLLPAVALHGAILVTCAFAAWCCFRRQSAARIVAGGRAIMAATLLLAAVEAGVALSNSPPSVSAFVDGPAPPLPQDPGAAEDSLLAAAPELPPLPASGADASPPSLRRWELSAGAASLVTWVWCTGAGLVLAAWAFSLLARWRLVRLASAVEDAAWLALLQRTRGGRGVKLLQHPDNIIPCAWHGVILLPVDAAAWSLEQRRLVLSHECAHLHRRDPFWLAVSQWFLALQWFNPIAWCIVRRCRFASERAADDAVLAATRDAPAYAGLLVACARSRSRSRSAVCAMASPSTVGRRVECILDEAADRRSAGFIWRAAWAAVFALIAAAVVLFTPLPLIAAEKSIEPELPPEAGPAPATDPAAELRNKIANAVVKEAKWADVPLSQAADELKQQHGINIIIRGGDDKKLAMHMRNVPLHELLNLICETTGTQFEVHDAAVVIFPADAAPTMTTMTFRLPEKVAARLSDKLKIKELLEQAGIKFPEGSAASVDSESSRLIVKTTPAEHARIETYLETGNADARFTWAPVMLREREYVSADQVRRFYAFRDVRPGTAAAKDAFRPDHPETDEVKDTLTFRSAPLVMEWRRNDPVIRINNVRFVLEHPVVESENTLWISRADLAWILEPVLRPARITHEAPLTTVVIDAGHGGRDSGAAGPLGSEARYTLDTATLLRQKLEADGWTVIMTRTEDKFMSRRERTAIANRDPNAVFVSIHFNAVQNTSGFETFILKPSFNDPVPLPKETAENVRAQGAALALAIHANCVQRLTVVDGGVKGAAYETLAGLRVPGILVEGGNLMNAKEAALIADPDYRSRMAAAIAQGLENYRKATGRMPAAAAPPKEIKIR